MFEARVCAVNSPKDKGLVIRYKVYPTDYVKSDEGDSELREIAKKANFSSHNIYTGYSYDIGRLSDVAKLFGGYTSSSSLLFYTMSDAEQCRDYLESLVVMLQLNKKPESGLDIDFTDTPFL